MCREIIFYLKQKDKLNNKGLSLIELIIVIAIMSVMLGAAGFTMSMLSGAEAKRAAQNFYAQLNDVKTTTMSMAAENLVLKYFNENAEIGRDVEGFYVEKTPMTIIHNHPESSDKVKIKLSENDYEYSYIGAPMVEVYVYLNDGLINNYEDVKKVGCEISKNTGSVVLEFDRRTGGLSKVESSDKSKSISSIKEDDKVAITDRSDRRKVFFVFHKGIKTYQVSIEPISGKCRIE